MADRTVTSISDYDVLMREFRPAAEDCPFVLKAKQSLGKPGTYLDQIDKLKTQFGGKVLIDAFNQLIITSPEVDFCRKNFYKYPSEGWNGGSMPVADAVAMTKGMFCLMNRKYRNVDYRTHRSIMALAARIKFRAVDAKKVDHTVEFTEFAEAVSAPLRDEICALYDKNAALGRRNDLAEARLARLEATVLGLTTPNIS